MPPTRRSDLANNLSGMHIFEGRYFNINRKLLRGLGLWPYEMKVKKFVLRSFFIISVLLLFSVPQLISLKLHYKNIDKLMLNVFVISSLFVVILKMIGMIVAEKNMMKLYESMANNWQLIQDQSERAVLHEYSKRARTITIFYGTALATATAIWLMLPLIPAFLDAVNPLENPRPEIDLMGGEYLIDRRSHFMTLYLVQYFPIMMPAIIVIAIDTIYIVTSEHCCMLFEIVRYRLVKLKEIVQKSSSSDQDVDSYDWLRRTIQLHQNALTFTSLLRDSYSTGFLFIVTAGLVICPLNCYAIILNLDKPLHLLPYVASYSVVMIQGFSMFYPGQTIIDHQLRLCDAAYCNEWYVIPLRTRKMLLIFMLRCTKPTTMSAGGLLEINFEVYFKALKTTVSYITVVWSFR